MITIEAKGFYFFDWEIQLMQKIGLRFHALEKTKNGTFKVTENPLPIKGTSHRIKLLQELPYKMNAIEVKINQ